MKAILVHPQNDDQLKAITAVLKALKIPFEAKDKTSLPNLTKADIDEAYNELRANKYTVIDTNDLWK